MEGVLGFVCVVLVCVCVCVFCERQTSIKPRRRKKILGGVRSVLLTVSGYSDQY